MSSKLILFDCAWRTPMLFRLFSSVSNGSISTLKRVKFPEVGSLPPIETKHCTKQKYYKRPKPVIKKSYASSRLDKMFSKINPVPLSLDVFRHVPTEVEHLKNLNEWCDVKGRLEQLDKELVVFIVNATSYNVFENQKLLAYLERYCTWNVHHFTLRQQMLLSRFFAPTYSTKSIYYMAWLNHLTQTWTQLSLTVEDLVKFSPTFVLMRSQIPEKFYRDYELCLRNNMREFSAADLVDCYMSLFLAGERRVIMQPEDYIKELAARFLADIKYGYLDLDKTMRVMKLLRFFGYYEMDYMRSFANMTCDKITQYAKGGQTKDYLKELIVVSFYTSTGWIRVLHEGLLTKMENELSQIDNYDIRMRDYARALATFGNAGRPASEAFVRKSTSVLQKDLPKLKYIYPDIAVNAVYSLLQLDKLPASLLHEMLEPKFADWIVRRLRRNPCIEYMLLNTYASVRQRKGLYNGPLLSEDNRAYIQHPFLLSAMPIESMAYVVAFLPSWKYFRIESPLDDELCCIEIRVASNGRLIPFSDETSEHNDLLVLKRSVTKEDGHSVLNDLGNDDTLLGVIDYFPATSETNEAFRKILIAVLPNTAFVTSPFILTGIMRVRFRLLCSLGYEVLVVPASDISNLQNYDKSVQQDYISSEMFKILNIVI